MAADAGSGGRIADAILTIGHSTHPIERFLGLLQRHDVACVIDVRRIPRSRRHPQFDRDALQVALAGAGIAYRHAPVLGGLRDGIEPDATRHGAIRNEMLRRYAAYAECAAFQQALRELVARAADRRSAIMCAEADWRQCHRQIIADYLVAARHPVAHIMGGGGLEPAQLAPAAVIRGDGGIDYPARKPQLDLGL